MREIKKMKKRAEARVLLSTWILQTLKQTKLYSLFLWKSMSTSLLRTPLDRAHRLITCLYLKKAMDIMGSETFDLVMERNPTIL
jgi:hypothetical protein